MGGQRSGGNEHDQTQSPLRSRYRQLAAMKIEQLPSYRRVPSGGSSSNSETAWTFWPVGGAQKIIGFPISDTRASKTRRAEVIARVKI